MNRCSFILQVSGSIHRGSICEFLNRSKESSVGSTWVRSRLEFVEKYFRLPDSHSPGSNPRRERVRSPMSLACRLRSERPGFESGFGPTAIQRWRAPSELAQQRRNERRHGTTPTPTDVTDAEERPQLRHCAWSRKNAPANHDQHLSVVTRALLPTNCEPGRRLLG